MSRPRGYSCFWRCFTSRQHRVCDRCEILTANMAPAALRPAQKEAHCALQRSTALCWKAVASNGIFEPRCSTSACHGLMAGCEPTHVWCRGHSLIKTVAAGQLLWWALPPHPPLQMTQETPSAKSSWATRSAIWGVVKHTEYPSRLQFSGLGLAWLGLAWLPATPFPFGGIRKT